MFQSPMSTTPSPPPSLNPEGGSTGGKESPSLNNTGWDVIFIWNSCKYL